MNLKTSLMFCLAMLITGCGGGSTSVNQSTLLPEPEISVSQPAQDPILSDGGSVPLPVGQPTSVGYTLQFQDEFSSSIFNTSKWNDHLWYQASNSIKNYAVSGGSLLIWPQKDSLGRFIVRTVDTDKKFYLKFGYIEVRAKLPIGKGVWPTIWGLNHDVNTPYALRPSIGVASAYPGGGTSSGWSTSSFHPTAYGLNVVNPNQTVADSKMVSNLGDLSSTYHIYGVKWEPTRQSFYFDGNLVYTINATLLDREYLILGVQYGGTSGLPNNTTPTGKTNSLSIDYVRAWSFTTPPSTTCSNGATNFSTCDTCPSGQSLQNGVCTTIPHTCSNGETDYSTCVTCPVGQSMINGVCEVPPVCSNGGTNYPDCNVCPTSETMINGSCATPLPVCSNGATNYSTCTTCPVGQSMINGSCATPPPTCSNGTTDYPTCVTCPSGQQLINDSCVTPPPTCRNGATDYPTCTTCSQGLTLQNGVCAVPPPTCSNGATNYSACDTCPQGQVLINGTCSVPPPTCSNGATNYSTCTICPQGQSMINSVCAVPPPTCSNGATNYSACDTCPQGQMLVNGTCTAPPTCTNGATDYPTCATCPLGQSIQNGTCVTPPPDPSPVGQDSSAWALSFSDDFTGSAIDTTKWNTKMWWESVEPTQNWEVSNGSLKIWPQLNGSGQFFNRNFDTDGGKFSQTYGYFEIEAKLPIGKGPWPAFWLYAHPCNTNGPTDKCRPEIDVMEAYSGGGPSSGWSTSLLHPNNYGLTLHEANANYSTHIVPLAYKQRNYSPWNTSPLDLAAEFHQYGVKWEPSGITFYFDGQQVGDKWLDTSNYYNQPMYIILSYQLGSASGAPDGTTPTGIGNSFEIRYVRAWKAR